ncbi:MAG: LLM class flavin-dependent oxidoreductase [Verrucomicrobia bacterium]|nr:LLM class flavin-dependent oxidoreductase [Verrucomicrobiota bacterium]MBV9272457.1 LLM class flavin-dependent oxidoreductase [Verrucomicrobiota bacterium]
MSKEIRFNAFVMNCVGHMAPGLWRHPRDRSDRYVDLEHWTDLARLLERGYFDGVFLADVLGPYDVYQGRPDAAIYSGIQIPVNDPMMLVPAMAGVTEHLGFGVTCALTYEHPYSFARRASTLDHLTKGRFGWNIVSGYLNSAARNFGFEAQTEHDDRYELAEEYLEVCYKLWEQSWQTGAVRRDRKSGVFADPAKVHGINHLGTHFKVPGFNLSEPSPQRTPVLYQAGASRRGKKFAAKHAECVFVSAPTAEIVKRYVQDLRLQAAELGRESILIFSMFTVIVAPTETEAKDRVREYLSYVDHLGALVLMSGWTGVDLSAYGLDEELQATQTRANQSALESFTVADPGRRWKIREIAEFVGLGGRAPVVSGSPQIVADRLQEWVETTGVDGFNLTYAVMPETYEHIIELLVPELQKRGVYKKAYRPGTFREKLFGQGSFLPQSHPGSGYRRE